MTAPLFGLILAGGASTRMQQDKATIAYHGQTQLRWAFEQLSQVCAATFVSVRPDQRDEATRAQFPQIVDQQPGIGPIAGISAALSAHPKAAWLIVACDLPFVTEQTLRHLIEHRAPDKIATAYRSSHDGLPEPLCAIWEPSAREAVLAHIAAGKQCPRKFLISADVSLLDLPDARALDNVNTREEFSAARAALSARPLPTPPPATGGGNENGAAIRSSSFQSSAVTGGGNENGAATRSSSLRSSAATGAENENAAAMRSSSFQSSAATGGGNESAAAIRSSSFQSSATTGGGKEENSAAAPTSSPPPVAGGGQGGGKATGTTRKTLRIHYYAILREQAGRSEETLDTTAATPADLYAELRQRHPFQLSATQLKVALNSEFSDWHTPLEHGDTVVFIPPVAGG
jgi:molybdopterin converting factor subunit 1